MADVRAVRQQFRRHFLEHLIGRLGILRERLVEQVVDRSRLDVREERALLNSAQVVREQVDDLMADISKFLWVHVLVS